MIWNTWKHLNLRSTKIDHSFHADNGYNDIKFQFMFALRSIHNFSRNFTCANEMNVVPLLLLIGNLVPMSIVTCFLFFKTQTKHTNNGKLSCVLVRFIVWLSRFFFCCFHSLTFLCETFITDEMNLGMIVRLSSSSQMIQWANVIKTVVQSIDAFALLSNDLYRNSNWKRFMKLFHALIFEAWVLCYCTRFVQTIGTRAPEISLVLCLCVVFSLCCCNCDMKYINFSFLSLYLSVLHFFRFHYPFSTNCKPNKKNEK